MELIYIFAIAAAIAALGAWALWLARRVATRWADTGHQHPEPRQAQKEAE